MSETNVFRSKSWYFPIISAIIICFAQTFVFADGANGLADKTLEELLDMKFSTASKFEQSISEAPASVSIVTSEDIRKFGYKTLQEILLSQPGFYTNNDRNYVYMGLRGFNRPGSYNNQILVLLNGHTTNEIVYGSPFFGYDFSLNTESIDRVEIVRGPGSALYGTGATFAVINIITKPGKKIDGLSVSGETGSFGKKQLAIQYGKEFFNNLDISLSAEIGDIKGEDLYFPEFDDSTNNFGVAEGMDWEKYNGAFFSASYKDLSFQFFYTMRRKGIPTAPWETVFNASAAKTTDMRKLAELKYTFHPFSTSALQIRAYYNTYNYGGVYPYYRSDEEPGLNLSPDSTAAEWIGVEAQFNWDLFTNNRLMIGSDYQLITRADYKLWDQESGMLFTTNHPNNIFSLYIQDHYQILENLSVSAGVRYDRYSLIGKDYLSPRASVVYNVTDVSTLKFIYGEALRSPNIYELYYEDPSLAYPNPDLKAERVREEEIIYEQEIGNSLFARASLFFYTYYDMIDQVIVEDTMTQFINLSNVYAHGIELELNGSLIDDLTGYLNYSWQNANDKTTNSMITNSPVNIIKAGLSQRLFGFLTLSAEGVYESGRLTVRSIQGEVAESAVGLSGIKTSSYFLANAYLLLESYNGNDGVINNILDHVSLSLRINNIFDTKYKLPGNLEHRQLAIEQNGRNLILTLKLSI